MYKKPSLAGDFFRRAHSLDKKLFPTKTGQKVPRWDTEPMYAKTLGSWTESVRLKKKDLPLPPPTEEPGVGDIAETGMTRKALCWDMKLDSGCEPGLDVEKSEPVPRSPSPALQTPSQGKTQLF